MRFKRFVIRNYRAITTPLIIDVEKNSLIPIIGINESGKTTILQALFAFDYFNDDLNGGRHLKDTGNLYGTSSPPATIEAAVEIDGNSLDEVFSDLRKKYHKSAKSITEIAALRMKFQNLPTILTITRNLDKNKYSIAEMEYSSKYDDVFARVLIRWLPYILYFDDFRDSVDERIEITEEEEGATVGWLAIVEQLFKQTNPDYSVFALPKLEERSRKSVLAKVNRHLNATLTREWQRFRLDETDALRIAIEYITDSTSHLKSEVKGISSNASANEELNVAVIHRSYLRLDLIERDANGDDHYFYIRDRSKGFFWFFNFVMKLEFNPKVLDSASDTIYLLDEPGSYLHASAQSKLCTKLRQLSERSKVIYCTHSHYLLDPDIIPFSSIKVADKSGVGDIQLIPINEHKGDILDRRSAFQPVLDALQIKPFLLDLTAGEILITEGIHDYYALEMFKGTRQVSILPSVGADSIPFYVSLMIAWRVRFNALWDNDEAGRKALRKATEYFGDDLAKEHFHLLPLPNAKTRNRILQDLFFGADIQNIKAGLGLPKQTSFQKMITALYYSSQRKAVLSGVSRQTLDNFEQLFTRIAL